MFRSSGCSASCNFRNWFWRPLLFRRGSTAAHSAHWKMGAVHSEEQNSSSSDNLGELREALAAWPRKVPPPPLLHVSSRDQALHPSRTHRQPMSRSVHSFSPPPSPRPTPQTYYNSHTRSNNTHIAVLLPPAPPHSTLCLTQRTHAQIDQAAKGAIERYKLHPSIAGGQGPSVTRSCFWDIFTDYETGTSPPRPVPPKSLGTDHSTPIAPPLFSPFVTSF